MLAAAERIAATGPVRFRMVLPDETLTKQAASIAKNALKAEIAIQTGGLAEALRQADLAIASTGTVTMECAYFGVPTVALYKTSWSTYEIGKRIINVPFLAMPNILAGEAIFPEFIQHDASPENISRAALAFLNNAEQRNVVKTKLARVVQSLGGPGASERAAEAIVRLLQEA